MLEQIHGVPARIATLKRKLKAREGKAEYKKNCEEIRVEIARLEAVTATKAELQEFLAAEAVASEDNKDVTL